MRHPIRLITWLLAACVLGINGFQAYWLYSTYQLTTAQFYRVGCESLASAVEQQLLANIETETPDEFDLVLAGTNGPRVGPRRVVYASDITVIPKSIARQQAVSIARHMSRIIIQDWYSGENLSLAALTHAYRLQLVQHGVDSAAVLDTFSVRQLRVLPHQPAPSFQNVTHFPGAMQPVLLSPRRGLYVRAQLPPPTQYLWGRLGGLVGGSVLLLALTSGCFVLVVHTMLTQRKLAEAKNDFINNMTHELKTPLTTVSAAVETLEYFGPQADPQQVQRYLHISRTELRRLATLVDKVLTIASKEGQTLLLKIEPVHPAELVQAAVHRYQLQASKPVHFHIEMDPADVVEADYLHLAGVIDNLIDNGIKYSAAQVTITVRSRRTANGWQLIVQDNGLGIADGYQAVVFDRFFRVPTGNLHPVKGFGLGLYYVRQVVERHGGHISVRSKPNKGSAFTLWLPLSQAALATKGAA